MSNNRTLFDKANTQYRNKIAIDTQNKMKEIAECLKQNKLAVKNIFEQNMYTEDEIREYAVAGHSSLSIFTWWPYDNYDALSTSGMRIGKSNILSTSASSLIGNSYKYNECTQNFVTESCKQIKEMFQEMNQQNGWGLKVIDNCEGNKYGGSLEISWK